MSRSTSTPARPWGLALAGALLVGAVLAQAAEHVSSRAAVDDPSAAIRSIVNSTPIRTRLNRWGVSAADVQMDVDAMSPSQRLRLLGALTRPWPATGEYGEADLQARYLVMVSLMRESTLFAVVVRSFR